TLSDTDGGIRLVVRKFSRATRNSANRGKAVNKASTTASRGTMLSTVVKVRLDATWVRFFSAARCSAKRMILRRLEAPARRPSAPAGRGWPAGGLPGAPGVDEDAEPSFWICMVT